MKGTRSTSCKSDPEMLHQSSGSFFSTLSGKSWDMMRLSPGERMGSAHAGRFELPASVLAAAPLGPGVCYNKSDSPDVGLGVLSTCRHVRFCCLGLGCWIGPVVLRAGHAPRPWGQREGRGGSLSTTLPCLVGRKPSPGREGGKRPRDALIHHPTLPLHCLLFPGLHSNQWQLLLPPRAAQRQSCLTRRLPFTGRG